MQDMTWQLEPYSGAWISRHSSRTASIRETRSRGCATAWPGFQTWWHHRHRAWRSSHSPHSAHYPTASALHMVKGLPA